MNRIPRFKSARENGMGMGAQIDMARAKAMVGASRKRAWEEVEGRIGSFTNSFTPSAIGWRSPMGPTMFGPFRCCMYPSTFRSIRVRKATARRIGTMYRRGLIK